MSEEEKPEENKKGLFDYKTEMGAFGTLLVAIVAAAANILETGEAVNEQSFQIIIVGIVLAGVIYLISNIITEVSEWRKCFCSRIKAEEKKIDAEIRKIDKKLSEELIPKMVLDQHWMDTFLTQLKISSVKKLDPEGKKDLAQAFDDLLSKI